MNFLEAVYSYVFGDGDPNTSVDQRALAQCARGVKVLLHADARAHAAAAIDALAALPAYAATYGPLRGSVAGLVARLLTCRPLAFYGPQDATLTREGETVTDGHGAPSAEQVRRRSLLSQLTGCPRWSNVRSRRAGVTLRHAGPLASTARSRAVLSIKTLKLEMPAFVLV